MYLKFKYLEILVETSHGLSIITKNELVKTFIDNLNIEDNDLALLQFQSEENYSVASIANSANLRVGDEVFEVGFPFLTQEYNPNLEKICGTTENLFEKQI